MYKYLLYDQKHEYLHLFTVMWDIYRDVERKKLSNKTPDIDATQSI